MERQPVRVGCGGIEMMKVGFISAVALLALTACGGSGGGFSEDITFDGQSYRTKLSTERGSRDEFIVTARPVSASLEGAREAARYEATSYCVNTYGSSAIRWTVGPDSPDEVLPISEDTLTLQGTCPQ